MAASGTLRSFTSELSSGEWSTLPATESLPLMTWRELWPRCAPSAVLSGESAPIMAADTGATIVTSARALTVQICPTRANAARRRAAAPLRLTGGVVPQPSWVGVLSELVSTGLLVSSGLPRAGVWSAWAVGRGVRFALLAAADVACAAMFSPCAPAAEAAVCALTALVTLAALATLAALITLAALTASAALATLAEAAALQLRMATSSIMSSLMAEIIWVGW